MTNCVNCGAVLHGNKCEYCGTEYNILEFEIFDCGLTFPTERYEARPIGDIGKTVFLTRKEAEAALKTGNNKTLNKRNFD